MDGFRQRLLSRREAVLIFTAVLLPVQFWMLYNLILAFPAYQFRLSAWDQVGFIAYTQAFALWESVLVLFGVSIVALIAPSSWRGEKRVACVSMLVFIASFWSILFHLNYDRVISLGVRWIIFWLLLVLATGGVMLVAIVRSPRLSRGTIVFLERAGVLVVFYLAIDLISVVIVGLRSIFPGV